MSELTETTEKLHKKLKPYDSTKLPLYPTSVRVAGGCGNLQEMLDILENPKKILVVKLEIERPDYSQFRDLKDRASATFKRRAAEYLHQWDIGFEFKISVSRSFYEALINYVDVHGLFDDDFDWCPPPRSIMQNLPKELMIRKGWTL